MEASGLRAEGLQGTVLGRKLPSSEASPVRESLLGGHWQGGRKGELLCGGGSREASGIAVRTRDGRRWAGRSEQARQRSVQSICPAELRPVQRDMCCELSLSPGRACSPEAMTAAPGLWCDWPVGRLSPLGGQEGLGGGASRR